MQGNKIDYPPDKEKIIYILTELKWRHGFDDEIVTMKRLLDVKNYHARRAVFMGLIGRKHWVKLMKIYEGRE